MQFEPTANSRTRRPAWLVSRAIALFAAVGVALVGALPVSAATLDRIRESGHIKLGYIADARPFSYRSGAGAPEGYAAALCQRIADQAKAQLALPQLTVDWVAVTLDNRLSEVKGGNVDLLCTPTIETLTRRQDVAFSIPIFAGGNRAIIRADAPVALRDALGDTPSAHPVWRGSPAAKVLEGSTFAVVAGTTTQTWLESRRATFQLNARIVPVPDYRAGLQQLLRSQVDVFFGERSLVLGALDAAERANLVVFDRLFTHESGALALARDDDDFRLLVDRALSQFYATPEFKELYAQWCGPFDDGTRAFFEWSALGQ
jgi:polar amino acid transport system substrate-binding protein